MNILLAGAEARAWRAFLLAHESDMVHDVQDFGSLRHVFLEVFERPPGQREAE